MARRSTIVWDGPFEGEVFALDAQHGHEIELQTQERRLAVYRLEDDAYGYDPSGKRVSSGNQYTYQARLVFVGWAL